MKQKYQPVFTEPYDIIEYKKSMYTKGKKKRSSRQTLCLYILFCLKYTMAALFPYSIRNNFSKCLTDEGI